MTLGSNFACYPPTAQRICTLSGAKQAVLEQRLLTFREGEELLRQSIRDLETAISDHDRAAALEVAARSVLLVCDILVTGLGALPAAGAAGMVVGKLYDAGKMAGSAAAGARLDPDGGIKLLAKNKAAVTELVAKEMGKSGVAKSLALAQQLVGYAEALWDFYTGMRAGRADGSSGLKSGLTTAEKQLRRIQDKIREIEATLQGCRAEEPLASALLR